MNFVLPTYKFSFYSCHSPLHVLIEKYFNGVNFKISLGQFVTDFKVWGPISKKRKVKVNWPHWLDCCYATAKRGALLAVVGADELENVGEALVGNVGDVIGWIVQVIEVRGDSSSSSSTPNGTCVCDWEQTSKKGLGFDSDESGSRERTSLTTAGGKGWRQDLSDVAINSPWPKSLSEKEVGRKDFTNGSRREMTLLSILREQNRCHHGEKVGTGRTSVLDKGGFGGMLFIRQKKKNYHINMC